MPRKISVEIVGDASQLERTFGRASKSATGFNRDLSHATRGALAGSGAFHSLGRSIAFASGGFLAFATVGQFLRTSVDAAKEAQVTQKQLGAQFRASGLDLGVYQKQIDKTANRLSLLAGFENDEIKAGFTTIFRTTGNVAKALRDTATAADLARAKHLQFSQASLIIAKTEAGNTTLLRRQGFQIAKNATAEQALATLRKTIAGQARAGTTAQERFGAVLHNTEEIIGAGLLPVLNRYLTRASVWLTRMNESGKLQKDVNGIVKDAGKVLQAAATAAHAVSSAFKELNRVTGGTESTLKLFADVWLLLKLRTGLIKWGVIQTGIAATGTEAAIAATKVGLLERALIGIGQAGILAGIGLEAFALSKTITTPQPVKVGLSPSSGPGHQADIVKSGGKFYVQTPGGRLTPYTGTPPVTSSTGPAVRGVDTPRRFQPHLSRQASEGANRARTIGLQGQFNLEELRLADAQRTNNVKLQRSILASEESIVLKLRDQAKTLKDRTKYAQQAASIESQLRGIDSATTQKTKAAADKRKAALQKAALGGVPLSLQLAQAKADAIAAGTGATELTKRQINVARQIRNAEMKAIRSHKLNMQGLIDAWNEVASINQQLKGAGKGYVGTYHKATTSLTAGLGLSHDAAVAIQMRAAQRDAHRGYLPSGPAVLGQPIHIEHFHSHAKSTDKLYSELEAVGKRRGQRRGTR